MFSYTHLTDRSAVDRALEEFDRLGRDAFLHTYGFGEARDYFLVTESGRYDSKAIFGVAFGNQFGVTPGPDVFSGGRTGAAGRLAELGYTIEGIDDRKARQTFLTFDEALEARPLPLGNVDAARRFLARRDDAEFYVPSSGAYIAAVPRKGNATAFIHSDYISWRTSKGEAELTPLTAARARAAGSSRASGATRAPRTPRVVVPERVESICPTCTMVLPVSGECEFC
ncbi:hypothetical protein [Agromyces mangrovi Wang et al. 2018]|uniref:hypothetical protein n=1 Tax=Agromyces mangrovi TaxID=1858653 RepID=UPI0025744F07|nr:hypothetical protein [Agromyces mangrovi]BDZ64112.1 hypothetical protein GCM10025877_10500 [Agromyces mangrovi]